MERVAALAGKTRIALGAVALAALAAPFATALATAEDPSAATLSAEQVTQARQMFNDNSCNSCHVLADASAAGTIGPALDGNANLDKAFVVDRVTNGQGAMPSFGWLPAEDIDLLASYIVQVKK